MNKSAETFFYSRKEENKEIIITFKNYPILMITYILPWLFAWILFYSNIGISIAIIILTMIYYIIMVSYFRNKLNEVKIAMRNNNVQVSGAKWSLNNPLKYIIRK